MSERHRTANPPSATTTIVDSFESYERQELADMLAHVIKTYVIDGTAPNRPELGIIDFPKHLRELTFPALVGHLKMHLDLPELNLFTVTGNEVLVQLAGRDYSLTNPMRGPTPQPAAPAQEETAGSRAPAAKGAAQKEEQEPQPDEPPELSDRFRMLELD